MSKTKINLIGGPFQHAHTSTLWKKAHHIEWDFGVKTNPVTFYVDYQIFDGLADRADGKKKYGWLLESRSIVPGLVEKIIINVDKFIDVYEAVYTHDQRLLQLHEKFKWVPAYGLYIDKPQLSAKNKLVSMITSNKTMTDNHLLRNKLASIWADRLDLYGRGYKEIEKKEEGLAPYMFSVAIENDCYKTYFTEKIMDCFAMGTIPIYLGTPDIREHFNEQGIISLSPDFNLDSLTEEIYYERMNAVKDNFERVQQYAVLEDWIYETYFCS